MFEIRDHLFSHPPFRNLPEEVVDALVPHIEEAYFQAGSMILSQGQENHFLFVIRSGAVEILRSSGELYTCMGEGECFGQFALMRKKRVRYAARAIEDTLVYKIPDAQFQQLIDTYDRFAYFMEDKSPIVGLLTGRDLRKRAIAKGLPLSTCVENIMSTDIICLQASNYAFDAMLTMMRHNLHHLPILDQHTPVGVITVADLIRYESHGSVYLVGDIFRQKTVENLAAISQKIRQIFVQLVNEDVNSHTIGAAISRMGISISQRLLQLGEKELGPPPIPYCLLALGSMARDEMTIVTDQDNAFVLDDAFDPDTHDPYFKALARVHALACGAMPLNTEERLAHVKETPLLAESVGDDLLDALELISIVRIRHQARQVEAGISPDNNVIPDTISSFERNHLKDAFQIISQAQSFLKYRYNVSPAMQTGINPSRK